MLLWGIYHSSCKHHDWAICQSDEEVLRWLQCELTLSPGSPLAPTTPDPPDPEDPFRNDRERKCNSEGCQIINVPRSQTIPYFLEHPPVAHFLSSLSRFSFLSPWPLSTSQASLSLRENSKGVKEWRMMCQRTVSSVKMRSCTVGQNLIAHLFPFLPWKTWSLHGLNNTVKIQSSQTKAHTDIKCISKMKGQINYYMSWFFSYLITHTSAGLPSCAFVSLGTDRFTCSFIFAQKFITSDYETFCDGITFLLTCCFSCDYT